MSQGEYQILAEFANVLMEEDPNSATLEEKDIFHRWTAETRAQQREEASHDVVTSS